MVSSLNVFEFGFLDILLSAVCDGSEEMTRLGVGFPQRSKKHATYPGSTLLAPSFNLAVSVAIHNS